MTEIALYGLDIVTRANRCHSIAVTKIVESCVRPADAFRNPLKVMIYQQASGALSRPAEMVAERLNDA